MRFRWPADTVFTQRVLTVEQQTCSLCQRALPICDHRFHRIYTFQGPVEIVCKLVQCPDPHCPAHAHTLSPLAEAQLTLPWWTIGWDVFCWLGQRRFARHWSIPQLRDELKDTYHIPLSDDALAGYLRRYQTMVAARQQDAALLAQAYRDIDSVILSIDGLQPEKGHETLYVVRELRGKRVWFAQALLSSAAGEIRPLIAKAKEWAEQMGKPVALWLSDKQEAFVTGIAAEFPGVPHRYCQNHFLRDVAEEVLAADSHAKVKMRTKVRGLRAIERDVLSQQRAQAAAAAAPPAEQAAGPAAAAAPPAEQAAGPAAATAPPAEQAAGPAAAAGAAAGPLATTAAAPPDAGAVVLDYCAAVRGILNDGQGGPLQPPGLRMAEALGEVQESIQRNLAAKKGGALRSTCGAWAAASTGACRRWLRSRSRFVSKSRKFRGSRQPWTRSGVTAPRDRSGSGACGSDSKGAAIRCGCRWPW